ncbi:hypothetical protein DVH24_000123 [Malus domestica]|uniref:F-box domain-containing protein n=1 Tax=Malus domestica TaxID=3750 RepID=A0A498J2D6_MALDO|nr:hypothetical protein DVH24_000123 [Malus domestica]
MMKKARTTKKDTTTPLFIQSLMGDLLVEILTKVASRSFHDLYSTKMVCKKFNQIAKHNRIFKHINIHTFERLNPDEQVSKFLKCCRDCIFENDDLQESSSSDVSLQCDLGAPPEGGGIQSRKASSFCILSTIRKW